jgi:signal transduction histidine kinase
MWMLGFTLTAIAALSALSYVYAIDYADDRSYVHELRQLSTLDAQLNEAVLKCRAELVEHYDDLVKLVRSMHASCERLRTPPHFVRRAKVAKLQTAVRQLQSKIERKEQLLEDFKFYNAVTRNARDMVLVAAHHCLEASQPDRRTGIVERTPTTLLLLLDVIQLRSDHGDQHQLLRELRQNLRCPPTTDLPAALIRHLELLLQNRPRLDRLVTQLLQSGVADSALEAEAEYGTEYATMVRYADYRDWALFTMSVCVTVLGATSVLFRLQRGALALRRMTGKLRVANRALRQEQRRERELTHLKSQFVSMTSHEFRTPLSAIQSSAELLEHYGERWSTLRRREHLARIRGEVQSMSQLLDEILLVGRAEAGILNPSWGPVDLSHCLSELVDTMRRSWPTSCNISYDIQGQGQVESDERLLRHLLANLLENSVKYSPPGAPITMLVRATDHAWSIAVRDSGIGIPEQDLPNLFTSFRRGSNVGQIRGTGLGLTVVQHVVRALGGSIQVESQVGVGSCFSVSLPQRSTMATRGGLS